MIVTKETEQLYNRALVAAVHVDFLEEDEIYTYAAALFAAMMWGKETDMSNNKLNIKNNVYHSKCKPGNTRTNE